MVDRRENSHCENPKFSERGASRTYVRIEVIFINRCWMLDVGCWLKPDRCAKRIFQPTPCQNNGKAMIAYSRCLFLPAAALVLAGCSTSSNQQPTSNIQHPASAPDLYRVKLETGKGDIVLEVHKDWAPLGADRFDQLVQSGFFDCARFFRVISGFMGQFGIAGDPKVQSLWRMSPLMDAPVKQRNTKGRISFAMAGPPSGTTP